MSKILLIEDEESLNQVVTMNLEMEGYEVTSVSNGKEALNYANDLEDFALIILDVMLPEVSGWDICTEYKAKSNTPILFVSARGTSGDKIKGLKLGADDFLAKPFDLEELLLRVQVLIQRKSISKTLSKFSFGEFEVNLNTFDVFKNGEFLTTLSKREIGFLKMFNEHEGEVISRDDILDELWGTEQFPTSRTIDNYILQFRKLFEKDPKHPVYFHSIRGVGYKFTKEYK